MMHISRRSLVATIFFSFVAYFVASTLVAAPRQAQSPTPAVQDRGQWRKLHRRMSKDDVRKLLGEPERVSVSRFFESWDYGTGSVTFDGKARVDFWSEP